MPAPSVKDFSEQPPLNPPSVALELSGLSHGLTFVTCFLQLHLNMTMAMCILIVSICFSFPLLSQSIDSQYLVSHSVVTPDSIWMFSSDA